MISQFGSFIEFMAAIYVTMNIDNLIAKRFWTHDFKSMLGDLFIRWRVPYVSNASSKKYRDINDIQKLEECLSRRRGTFMLSFCVFLLIYIGFEPTTYLMTIRQVATTYFSLCVSFVYVFVVFFCNRFFLSRLWSLLLSIMGIPLVYFIADIYRYDILFESCSLSFLQLFYPADSYLVITLLTPIVWQLLRSWLYSQTNMVRIQYLIREELDNLDKARQYKKGEDINQIVSWYRNDVVKRVGLSGADDEVDGNMIQTFNTRLRDLIQIPHIWQILPYINKEPLEEYAYTEATVYYSEPVSTPFDDLCKEYHDLANKPNIVDFAKSKKIDHKEFREYYQRWIINNAR